MNQIKAIVFDLDGTLVDTLSDIAHAMNETLRAGGLPTHEVESYRYFVGEGSMSLVEHVLPADAAVAPSEMLQRFRDYYDNTLKSTARPYPGVTELLGELRKRAIKSAVLSNKPHHPTQVLVERHFPEHHFAHVCGAQAGVPLKPDIGAAKATLEALSEHPQACIFLGDTKVDMMIAKALGMKAVGVSWGFRKADELWEHGADAVIDRAPQLLTLL